MKIYVVGHNESAAEWLDGKIIKSFDEADLILFTGGADVIPSIYHDVTHPRTKFDGKRDAREIGYFCKALSQGKKMLGICRGSQFLTVMNGGHLIQDVTNHAIAQVHPITAPGFGDAVITSTHHQMMYPYGLPNTSYQIIAYTPESLSEHYQLGDKSDAKLPDNFVEPEIVFYPRTKSLGIQGHPEYMMPDSKGVKLCKEIVNSYLFDKI